MDNKKPISKLSEPSDIKPIPHSSNRTFASHFPIFLISGIIILITLIVSVRELASKSEKNNMTTENSVTTEDSAVPNLTIQNSLTPTPDLTVNWKTYTNSTYGYTFQYPPEGITYSGCKKDKSYKYGYYPVKGILPVRVSEENNTVYIGTTDHYEPGGVKYINGDGYFTTCDKIVPAHPQGNLIKAGSAKNDQDLDVFIKQNFDKRCSIYKKTPDDNNSFSSKVFRITLVDDKGIPEGADNNYCSTFGSIIFYQDKNLVLYFRSGQACALWSEYNGQEECDSGLIYKSLKPL